MTLNTCEAYMQTIRQAYPDLRFTTARLNTQGQNNHVLILDGQTIFRFPKYPHLVEGLKIEVDILRGARAYLPLPIPNPEFLHLEAQAFLGYRRLPGVPLQRAVFQEIKNEKTLDGLANQLAGFLKALHNLPARQAIQRELPLYETRQEYQDMFARTQEKLFSFMRPDARQWATNHFETFLGKASNFEYYPVLRHGDFGTSNLLFDAKRQRITGVVDFSSTGLGDPAVDFAGLLSSYGEGFLMRCVRTYPELEGLLPRVRFFRGVFALEEALFGIENGDMEAFRAGISDYI